MQRFPSPAPPPLENFTLVAPSFRNAPAATLPAGPPAAWQNGRKKSYAGWRQKKRGEVPLPSKTLLWSLQAFVTRLPPLCPPVPRRHGKKAGKKATPDGGRKKRGEVPLPSKTLLWSLQAFATRLPPLCPPVSRRHDKKTGKKLRRWRQKSGSVAALPPALRLHDRKDRKQGSSERRPKRRREQLLRYA